MFTGLNVGILQLRIALDKKKCKKNTSNLSSTGLVIISNLLIPVYVAFEKDSTIVGYGRYFLHLEHTPDLHRVVIYLFIILTKCTSKINPLFKILEYYPRSNVGL